ncbi:MAG: zinc-ribbon domain-containing protein [Lachnospiraceae bacterium]|nr:zinc-ribbon domain-containing protein [Lachnospiraceae bacterium]
MIIVYGYQKYLKVGKTIGTNVCSNCGFTTEKTLAQEKFKAHIFYIPIFMRTKRRVVVCPVCGMECELSKSQFDNLNR